MKMANTDIASGGAGGPRRRARLSSQSSEDKKPRGRPRVEPQDETAADRRRTQIRLAQRAYRLRKETTISSLKDRTTELTNIVNDMHAALSKFSGMACAEGLESMSNCIFTELQETEHIFRLLKERAIACCEDVPDTPEKLKAESDASLDSASDGQSPSKKLKRSLPEDIIARGPTISTTIERGVPSVWGYEMIYDGKGSFAEQKPDTPMPFDNGDTQNLANFWAEIPGAGPMDVDLQTPRPNFSSSEELFSITNFLAGPTPDRSLRSPTSLAWQETSFSRQLHRRTLEAGVLLIQQQLLKPEIFNKKFQMCLPFGNSDQILSKIKNTLSRDASEPLDWDDHPMRHLGGAGTHFSRRGDSGSVSPASQIMQGQAIGALGPNVLAELMNSANESNSNGSKLSIAGFEGEWFDAQDVQGYLERKGIKFEPGSNFAVIESSSEASNDCKGSPMTSTLDSLDFFSIDHRGSGKRSRNSSMDAASKPQIGPLSDWDGTSQDPLGPPTQIRIGSEGTQGISPGKGPDNKRVVIDVSNLVKELVKRATCLGRTPGYRRRDVDKAFQRSLDICA
ncbi:hypothetical protein FH972_026526 [Carpinus fangiana]|uniref:BZIP domain-containing protein n=1 Tax=Carpinus fangiana TaxID=176857 RepID=A0A5N6L582_9ROSI|nr:hypothetical protein FH972_026526 [Carpinus fangiana]